MRASKSRAVTRSRFDDMQFKWTVNVSKPCPQVPDHTPYSMPKGGNPIRYVLYRGCCAADASESTSLSGRYGHAERANAWTHLVPSVLLFCFAAVRPFVLGWTTTSDYLSFASILVDATMFAISTAYHIGRVVPSLAAPLLAVDISAISLTISASVIADLCAVTRDFQGVSSARTWLDPLLASLVFILFTWYRRALLPEKETLRDAMDGEGCGLGLYRTGHSPLEHRTLRSTSKVAMTCMWCLFIPSAIAALETQAVVVWVSGAALGALLLAAGTMMDNAYLIDNSLKSTTRCGPCGCNSKALGCVFVTHTLWHLIAVAATLINIVARELVIASWK